MNPSPSSHVRSLILLILLSVFSAFAIAVFSVQKFGPTGAYEVKNALITPYLLENMSYDDTDTKTGGQTRFIYDDLLFSYRDVKAQKTLTVPLSMSQYRQFYETISTDTSITDGNNLAPLFDSADPDKLVIYVKTVSEDPLQSEKLVFQEIQFAREGNFYRIELRQELNPDDKWAYYKHASITEIIKKLFVKS